MSRHDGGFRRKDNPPAPPQGRRSRPPRSHGSAEYEERLRRRHQDHDKAQREDIGQRGSDSETPEERPNSEYWVG